MALYRLSPSLLLVLCLARWLILTAVGRPPVPSCVAVITTVKRGRMKVEIVYTVDSRCSLQVSEVYDNF
jgi:hypothetical protein